MKGDPKRTPEIMLAARSSPNIRNQHDTNDRTCTQRPDVAESIDMSAPSPTAASNDNPTQPTVPKTALYQPSVEPLRCFRRSTV
jgi:hypothetical protein